MPGPRSILKMPRLWLTCALLTLLLGCGAKQPATEPAPPATPSRPSGPTADKCGPALNLEKWKVQCENESLAMMCRKSDPNDRRCACKESGKYRWTYGVYCKRALPCGRRGCR